MSNSKLNKLAKRIPRWQICAHCKKSMTRPEYTTGDYCLACRTALNRKWVEGQEVDNRYQDER